MEKATNKKYPAQRPDGRSDDVKERSSSGSCYAESGIYLAQSIYLRWIEVHHALKAPFPSVKGGEGPLRCVTEGRGEEVPMGSGFEHLLV